jgi:hypothetical protein
MTSDQNFSPPFERPYLSPNWGTRVDGVLSFVVRRLHLRLLMDWPLTGPRPPRKEVVTILRPEA